MARRSEIPENYLDPEEATGRPFLPVSRVRKIIKADEDITGASTKHATALATIATEMFIQYMAEQGLKALSTDKKPRKTLQYRDVASAVARIDNLEFLSDVIPTQLAVTKPRQTKAAKSRTKSGVVDDKKQMTLTAELLKPGAAKRKHDENAEEVEGLRGEPSLRPVESEKSPPEGSDKARKTCDEAEDPCSDVDMT